MIDDLLGKSIFFFVWYLLHLIAFNSCVLFSWYIKLILFNLNQTFSCVKTVGVPGSVGRNQTAQHNKSILVFQRNSASVKAKTSQASHWYFNPSVLVIQMLLHGFRLTVKYFHVVYGRSTCIKTTNYIDLKIAHSVCYTILSSCVIWLEITYYRLLLHKTVWCKLPLVTIKRRFKLLCPTKKKNTQLSKVQNFCERTNEAKFNFSI